jgi:hypothetical protein
MDVVEDIDAYDFLQFKQKDIYGFDQKKYAMILIVKDLVGNHNF